MIDLSGKEAIVTGGGSGIGRGICSVLALAGANVLVTDISRKSAEETMKHCGHSDNFRAKEMDVTNENSIDEIISEHIKERKKIDILVNNAGIIGSEGWSNREIPNNQDWTDVYEVNLRGVVKVSERVSKELRIHKRGKIVNIASIAARQGSPDSPHYSTSKAAVVSWTQSHALQMARYDVNVNAVCPGLIWTPIWESIARRRSRFGGNLDTGDLEGKKLFDQTVKSWIPLQREQTPEDIGNVVAFLASDLAKNITGQSINVDGGRFTN
ncbi:SDR family oxidoreductase [Chloroflexi bacterium]|nr:SDR family oxidoreductase [Chloroflexota bacterium]